MLSADVFVMECLRCQCGNVSYKHRSQYLMWHAVDVICRTFQEFQRRLGSKQPVYDGVNKAGRTLKDRCPSDDMPTIQAMLTELKTRWNSVCSKSVDR